MHVSPVRPVAVRPVAPRPQPVGGSQATYRPAYTTRSTSSPSTGRIISWIGGAWAANRYVLPALGRSPGGLLVGAVWLAGAWAGSKLYSMMGGR